MAESDRLQVFFCAYWHKKFKGAVIFYDVNRQFTRLKEGVISLYFY
jgi:hypothetical protein